MGWPTKKGTSNRLLLTFLLLLIRSSLEGTQNDLEPLDKNVQNTEFVEEEPRAVFESDSQKNSVPSESSKSRQKRSIQEMPVFKTRRHEIIVVRMFQQLNYFPVRKQLSKESSSRKLPPPPTQKPCPVGFVWECVENKCICNKLQCRDEFWMCRKESRCIRKSQLCDNFADCTDRSDEEDCAVRPPCPTEAPFQCGNGECIFESYVCNGVANCMNGFDEQNCQSCVDRTDGRTKRCQNTSMCIRNQIGFVCPYETCPGDNPQFRCKSNTQCIKAEFQCDKESDCLDGSDEVDCEKCPSQVPFRCPVSQKCILQSYVCDGDPNDCSVTSLRLQDNSDEENCTQSIDSTP